MLFRMGYTTEVGGSSARYSGTHSNAIGTRGGLEMEATFHSLGEIDETGYIALNTSRFLGSELAGNPEMDYASD